MKLETFVEEWKDSFKHKGGKTIEIFVNPTPKELRELGDDYRWITDNKKKKVYAFTSSILHHIVLKELGYRSSKSVLVHFFDPNLLAGVSNRKYERVTIDSIYIAPMETTINALKKNWSFAYPYVKGLEKWLKENKKPALKELERRIERENPGQPPLDLEIDPKFLESK